MTFPQPDRDAFANRIVAQSTAADDAGQQAAPHILALENAAASALTANRRRNYQLAREYLNRAQRQLYAAQAAFRGI